MSDFVKSINAFVSLTLSLAVVATIFASPSNLAAQDATIEESADQADDAQAEELQEVERAQAEAVQILEGVPAIAVARAWALQDDQDEMETVEATIQQNVAMRIADIQRTCDLDEAQIRKLEIAAKGATVKVLEMEKKAREEMLDQFGGPNAFFIEEMDENGEPVEDLDADDDEMAEVEDNADDEMDDEGQIFEAQVAMPMMFGGELISGVTFESQDVWVTAVERVLSVEQQAAYKIVVETRLTFQRDAAVAIFISRVDELVCLSTDQRGKLLTVVGESYGEDLRVMNSMSGTGAGMFFGGIAAGEPVEEEAETVDADDFTKKVNEILDEQQYKCWQENFEPELTGNWGNWNGGGGGIF